MSSLPDRPPMAEMAKRAAEAGAGFAAAGKAVALQDYVERTKQARQRVRDSHIIRNKLIGGEPDETEPEAMGNIIVTGDVYGDRACETLRQAANGSDGAVAAEESVPGDQPRTPPEQVKSKLAAALAPCLPYVLAAALGGGGVSAVLVPWILSKAPKPPAATADTDTTRRVDVEVWRPE